MQPDYVFAISQEELKEDSAISKNVTRRKSGPPHVIVCSAAGEMGWLASDSKSCERMRSSPYSKPARLLVTSTSRSNILLFNREGVLSMYHADTGVQLPSPGGAIGVNTCSFAATSNDGALLAVGTTCGRIIVYSMPKMSALKIIECPFGDITKAVSAMMFTHCNQSLVVVFEDRGVYLFDLNKHIVEKSGQLIKATGNESVILCSERENDNYWGLILPKSSSLILYKVHTKKSRGVDSGVLTATIIWEALVKDKLTLNKFNVGQTIYDVGVNIFDARFISFGDGFLIKVLHHSSDDNDGRETSLSTIIAERRKIYETQVLTKEVQLKHTMPIDGYVAHTFVDDMLLVSTKESVLVYGIGRKQFMSGSALVLAELNSDECMINSGAWATSSLCAKMIRRGERLSENSLDVFVSLLGISGPSVAGDESREVSSRPRCHPALLKMTVKVHEDHEDLDST